MVQSPPPSERPAEAFSLPLFAVTVLGTLAALVGAVRFFLPAVWHEQLVASLGQGVVAFLAVSLLNCFIEYFFHRYILHTSSIPLLRRLYRQHTLHHALTHITRKTTNDGRGILFIENKFPIVEPEQGEASFFPWYTLAVFAVIISPVLGILQYLALSFPWFFGGFAALASSLTLYEVLHAINHWSFEKWEPLIIHPRWGWFWRPAYGFHLRHHAVIDCNESISGFFGLPLADWTFGTCVVPQTVYANGEAWSPEKFRSPRPRALIRWLDTRAEAAMHRRRAAAAAPTPASEVLPDGRAYTRGEVIANWVTHGVGLAVSVATLTLLIVFSSQRGDAWHVVSFTVFGLTLLLMHGVATLQPLGRGERSRWLLRNSGYAAGFLVVAGTYTPYLLTNLRGPWGWTLFGILWGLCGAAGVFRLLFGSRMRLASLFAYLFIAWLLVLAIRPLVAAVPPGGLWLLLGGAVSYFVGMLFWRWRGLRFHTTYRQAFFLMGSTCHCLAVLLFLLPR